MRNLTDSELAGIAQRAELTFVYGDRQALRAEDVADLIQEVRELHALRQHLMAMNRQAQDRLRAMGETNGGQAAAVARDAELDPP